VSARDAPLQSMHISQRFRSVRPSRRATLVSGEFRRTFASSGGENHAGLHREEAIEIGRLRTCAAEHVDDDADDGAADASPSPIHNARAVAGIEAAGGCRGEVNEDRRDHEGRHRSQKFDNRKHALEVGGGKREAATNSAGATVPESESRQPRADEGQCLT